MSTEPTTESTTEVQQPTATATETTTPTATAEVVAEVEVTEVDGKTVDITPAIVQQPTATDAPDDAVKDLKFEVPAGAFAAHGDRVEHARYTPPPIPFKTYHYMQVEGREELYGFGEHTSEHTLKKLAEIYPPQQTVLEEHKALMLVYTVPSEAAAGAWRKTTKSALLCAFNSTNSFMQNNLGCRLDNDDETWYKNHPWTTSSGLPAQHTISVLNELVRPYGLGVSQVYVRKGFITYDEHKEWYEVLGVNPMAVGDKLHSNAEYIETVVNSVPDEIKEQMRAALEEECKQYKFEYVAELPERALVTCAGGYDEKNPSTSGGGHASYHGPRAKNFRWEIAVAFDRIENCLRLSEPPKIPDSGDGVLTLDWMEIKCPDGSEHEGKTLRQAMFYGPRTGHYDNWGGGGGYYPNNFAEKNQRGLFGKPPQSKRDKKNAKNSRTTRRSGDWAGTGANQKPAWWGRIEVGDQQDPSDPAWEKMSLPPKLVQELSKFSQQVLDKSPWELPDYEWKAEDPQLITDISNVVAEVFLSNEGDKIAELHAQDTKPLYWSDVFHLQTNFTKVVNKIEEETLMGVHHFMGSLTMHALYQLEQSLLGMGIDQHFVRWFIHKMAY